nr:HAMP domain-containing sensor histidine kinase [Allomuricauda sp.]
MQRTSWDFLLLSVVLCILTGLALFFYTRYLLDEELEEQLESRTAFVIAELEEGRQVTSIPPLMEIGTSDRRLEKSFRDTMLYDPFENEPELFRELTSTVELDEKIYHVIVRSHVIESDDVLEPIVASFISILAGAFFVLFFLNKKRNRKLWEPFFGSLTRLKSFSLQSDEPLIFPESNIQEFQELNQELVEITNKLKVDYRNLKQFTADMSHETQTPLAIIQAKVENIINQNDINSTQYGELTAIQKEIKRLSQLNANLILLAKIDNHQFPEQEPINLTRLLKEKIENFSTLTSQEFQLSVKKRPKSLMMNANLAHALLNNLLTNAVKYGDGDKPIFIHILHNELAIGNYGKKTLRNPEKLFDRFYKEGKHPKSNGFGLSIVKKICDHYGFDASYIFKENHHVFKVIF